MKIDYLPRALKALEDAPGDVRRAFFKQVVFLADNLHHPSLHAKKYDESKDRWQARVNKGWRFYFNIVGDTYIIRDIVPHPKK
jgi:mRNA-degrading endonuclease RelE of RelBE toxin-antitoxin system